MEGVNKMKSKRAKRFLSLFLALTMAVGLLTVPASATETDGSEVWTYENQGTFFTFPSITAKSASATFGETTYAKGAKVQSSKSYANFSFTTTAVGTLTVYCVNQASSETQSGFSINSGETVYGKGGQGVAVIATISDLEAGTYEVTNPSAKEIDIYYVKWTPSASTEPTIKANEPTAVTISANSSDADNTKELSVTVENSEETVVWSSSATEKVTVLADENDSKKATITGVAATEENSPVTVTATLGSGDDAPTATFSVTVVAGMTAVTAISVSPATLGLAVGGTATIAETFTATVAPDDATDKTVTWSVKEGSEDYIEVADGTVTAKAAGTATLVATAGSKTAEVTVTVTAKPKMFNFDKDVTITAEGVDVTKFDSSSNAEATYMNGALKLAATGSKLSTAVGTSSGYTLDYKGVRMTRAFKPNTAGRTLTFTAPEKGTVSFVLYDTKAANENKGTIDVDGTLTEITNVPCVLSKDLEKDGTVTIQKGEGTASPMIFVLLWNPEGTAHTEHNMQSEATQISAANCTDAEKLLKWCEAPACVHFEIEDGTAATGHTYDTETGVCSVCGDVKLDDYKTAVENGTYTATSAVATSAETAAAAAKTQVEEIVNAKLTDANTGKVTVTVTASENGFTAAEDGTEATPNGTDGSYNFTVTLTTAANTTGVTTSEQAMTITAAAYGAEADKTALNEAITAAEAAAEAIKVDTDAANVDEGTKWITQEALDTYTAAIAAAKTVAEKTDATQTEVNGAVSTLAEATTAFEAAQQEGTKDDPNKLDPTTDLTTAADKETIADGTIKGPFSAKGMVKRSSAVPTVYAIETAKANEGGLVLTVPAGQVADLTIDAASNGSSNTTTIQLVDATGKAYANNENITTIKGANDGRKVMTWTALPAGTYTFGPTSGSEKATRVYGAEVAFEEAPAPTVDLTAAKTAVEEGTYTTTQAATADEAAAKAEAEKQVKALVTDSKITAAITKTGYTAPVAGTEAAPNGTDGAYKFTVTLSAEGAVDVTTEELTLTITATAYATDTPTPPEEVVVTGVSLNTASLELVAAEEAELKVSVAVTPDAAENKTVTWTSSNTAVATVDANGKVTAVAAGTATITVKSDKDDTKTATCTVTVLDGGSGTTTTTEGKLVATDMTAKADNEAITEGSLVTPFDVTGKVGKRTVKDSTPDADGNYPVRAIEIAKSGQGAVTITVPENATANVVAVVASASSSKSVTAELLNGDTVVEYEGTQLDALPSGDTTLTWNALPAGTYSLTAKTNSGDAAALFVRSITVTTTTSSGSGPVSVTGVTLDKTTAELKAGEGVKLTATVVPGNATNKKLSWSSSDPTVAAVDAEGNVTAVKAGAADITVTTANGKTATCAVTVAASDTPVVEVTGVTLNQTASVKVGKSVKLTATITPENATDKTLTWTSSAPGVATVDAEGNVKGIAVGTADITVTTANGKTATCTVTVAETQSSSGGTTIPTTIGKDGRKDTTTTTTTTVGAKGEGTTTTKTDSDGTVTATTKWKDGSTAVTTTKPDGSATTVIEDASGVKAEAATTTEGETTAKITLPSKVEKAIVTIPVKNATDGTVAVIVNADGTEKVIKTSAATEDGMSLLVSESVSIKLKDNAKSFIDIADDYWAKSSVDFVSSREIFKGTTDVTFSPLDVVDRGMMATVLYRLSGAVAEGENAFFDVVSDAWYTEAVIWANHSGVVTGYADGTFGPADAVTREQMATMLFRYAKAMGMDTSAKGDMDKFDDAHTISSWATEAMTWAVGAGLINGTTGDGSSLSLSPAKSTSRAEVAAIMQRMVKLMMQ